MAYAQLVFASTPQAGQVMKAIAKVLTGETNLANLEGVITSTQIDSTAAFTSEIVNTGAEAWVLQFPATLPGAANYQVNTFTVRSPCIANVKSKLTRFIVANAAGGFNEPINSGSTNYSSTTAYSIQVQGASAVDGAAGTTTNLTYRQTAGTWSTIRKQASTTEVYAVWLSWSARHLFVASTIGGRSCFHATVEFDDTTLTTFSNAAPVVHITGAGATTTLTNQTTTSTSNVNVVSMLSVYDPATSTTPGVRALTNTLNTANLNSVATFGLSSGVDKGGIVSVRTINTSTQKNQWLPAPILIDDSDHGNGILDLSKYSNMLIFVNASFELSNWTDSNGVVYKAINLYNAGYSVFSTILVKYG